MRRAGEQVNLMVVVGERQGKAGLPFALRGICSRKWSGVGLHHGTASAGDGRQGRILLDKILTNVGRFQSSWLALADHDGVVATGGSPSRGAGMGVALVWGIEFPHRTAEFRCRICVAWSISLVGEFKRLDWMRQRCDTKRSLQSSRPQRAARKSEIEKGVGKCQTPHFDFG